MEKSGQVAESRTMLERYLKVESDTTKRRDALEQLQRISPP